MISYGVELVDNYRRVATYVDRILKGEKPTAGVAALPSVSRIAWAQAYPTRPVRLVVGAPQGADSISSHA